MYRKFNKGTEKAGYELEVSTTMRRLSLKMWGVWTDETQLAKNFVVEMTQCLQALAETSNWNLVGDLRGYSSQPTVVGDMIIKLTKEAMAKKLEKVAVIHNSVMVKLFIGRLMNAAGVKKLKFCSTAEEAEAYLKSP